MIHSRSLSGGLQGLPCRGAHVIVSPRGQGLRVSFHACNDDDDVDEVLRALAAEGDLLARGARPTVRKQVPLTGENGR
jgi:hypothetical protein